MLFSFIWFLLIGVLAGWIAGKIMHGNGFGFFGNMIVGVVGAIIGGFLFRIIGFHAIGTIASLITAIVGAIVLLVLIGILKK